jgi:hypothetical protein
VFGDEPRYRPGEQLRREDLHRRDAELACDISLASLQIAAQLCVLNEHRLGAPKHGLASAREHDLTRRAREQLGVEVDLEALDGLAHRRGRDPSAPRALHEAPRGRNSGEVAQIR